MKCPDCGAELSTVILEVFSSKAFDVDHEQKLLIPRPHHEWDYGDYCCHCRQCGSLNVDEMLKDYELRDGYRNII
jgi:hypothetical protein